MSRTVSVNIDLSAFSDADIVDEFEFRGLDTGSESHLSFVRDELVAENVERLDDLRVRLERIHAELTRFKDIPEAVFLLDQEIEWLTKEFSTAKKRAA